MRVLQIPPAATQMEVCQPASSSEVQPSLFAAPAQVAALSEFMAVAEGSGLTPRPQRIASAPLTRQPITTGFMDNSPLLDTPRVQTTASTEPRNIRGARLATPSFQFQYLNLGPMKLKH